MKDRWLYPAIALSPEDRDADTLHFEIRAVQNPAGRGYKNTLVIFLDAKGKQLGGITFPAPQEEYSQVTLKLDGRPEISAFRCRIDPDRPEQPRRSGSGRCSCATSASGKKRQPGNKSTPSNRFSGFRRGYPTVSGSGGAGNASRG